MGGRFALHVGMSSTECVPASHFHVWCGNIKLDYSIFRFWKSQTLKVSFTWVQSSLAVDLTWWSRCWLKGWQHPHWKWVVRDSSRHRLHPQPQLHVCYLTPTNTHRSPPTHHTCWVNPPQVYTHISLFNLRSAILNRNSLKSNKCVKILSWWGNEPEGSVSWQLP